jgi:hypothetical protein
VSEKQIKIFIKIPWEFFFRKIRGLFVIDEKALREKTFGFFPACEFFFHS